MSDGKTEYALDIERALARNADRTKRVPLATALQIASMSSRERNALAKTMEDDFNTGEELGETAAAVVAKAYLERQSRQEDMLFQTLYLCYTALAALRESEKKGGLSPELKLCVIDGALSQIMTLGAFFPNLNVVATRQG